LATVAKKGEVSKLSSFTRTIPSYQKEAFVNQVLAQENHFIPLAYRPTKAGAGDFVYLIYRGVIVGRARISAVDPVDPGELAEEGLYPDWAKWVVRYTGRWEKPPREIQVQGHQSVRYLEIQSLNHLDSESW
jgi:hypothetical protein